MGSCAHPVEGWECGYGRGIMAPDWLDARRGIGRGRSDQRPLLAWDCTIGKAARASCWNYFFHSRGNGTYLQLSRAKQDFVRSYVWNLGVRDIVE